MLVVGAFVATIAAFALVIGYTLRSDDGSDVLVPREQAAAVDPFAYDEEQAEELEQAATFGLSQPLYAKSPGGVVATARRTESFRPLIEDAVDGTGFDADLVEAIVFLESGGRPDVIAGGDPVNASGLTQILAETAQSFLAMRVDLDQSRALTAQIAGAERRGNLDRARSASASGGGRSTRASTRPRRSPGRCAT